MNITEQPQRNWGQLLIIGGVLSPAAVAAALVLAYVWHLTVSA